MTPVAGNVQSAFVDVGDEVACYPSARRPLPVPDGAYRQAIVQDRVQVQVQGAQEYVDVGGLV